MEDTVIFDSICIVPKHKSHIKEFISNLPDGPGVYKFLDKSNFYSLNYGLFESIHLPHNINGFIKRTFCMEFLKWTR